MSDHIAVLGAGAFGTALAVALAQGGRQVTLWGRNADVMVQMARDRQAPRLPGASLPAGISPTADLLACNDAKTVLLAVPMQTLAPFLAHHPLPRVPLVACCKGIDLGSGEGPSAVLTRLCPGQPNAVLTGPGFAADIARGLPTALTLACRDEALGQVLQERLSSPQMRLYRTTDQIGAELGGALKNVIAIAAGLVIGAGFGESARAALMTRGFAEMQRLALQMGARPETLQGLSGLGDLILTCGSDLSRNFRYGRALGAGESFDRGVTIEGAATARAVSGLAHARGIDMPITEMVTAVIDGRCSIAEAAAVLLSRPLKQE